MPGLPWPKDAHCVNDDEVLHFDDLQDAGKEELSASMYHCFLHDMGHDTH